MASITITTTEEERNSVLAVIKDLDGKVTPVATIATKAGLKPSRARYALQDLIEFGMVEKIPYKAFNKHYVRYSYKVL